MDNQNGHELPLRFDNNILLVTNKMPISKIARKCLSLKDLNIHVEFFP